MNAADGVSRLIQPDIARLLRFRPEKGPDCQMRRRFFRRLLPVRAQDETTQQSSGYMVYEMVPGGEELKSKDYYNITN